MASKDDIQADDTRAGSVPGLVAAGGILAGIAASTCCLVPLGLFSLGVGGAWIGSLTRLAPYQPYFIAIALTCIGGGAFLVHRARRRACAGGATCARPWASRGVTTALVVASVLVGAALAFNLLAPFFLR